MGFTDDATNPHRNTGPMKPTVFIHTNAKQILGAHVASYALRRNSRNADAFDVRLIVAEEQAALVRRHGSPYLREGRRATWDTGDLQSFTPCRFLAPQEAGFRGRALVIDPDVFAVGDVHELLTRDLAGKAIACRKIFPGKRPAYYATSVMLLECARLKHWRWEECLERLFALELDYDDWMSLRTEPEGSIDLLEEEWNHFDTLDASTKLLHNTMRITQPWKTGLPVDFVKHSHARKSRGGIRRWLRPRKTPGPAEAFYRPHPDPEQERHFFLLLAECLDRGEVSEDLVRAEIERRHVRPDALRLAESLRESGARLTRHA